MSSGLSSGELTRLHEIFATNERIEKAVLFGSRAMDLARSNSDVDIALVGNALTTRDVLHLASQLEASPLPYQFDLLLYHSIESEDLLRHIEQYGKTLYKRDLPAGWREVALGEIATLIDYRGKTPKKTERGIPLITAKIIKNGAILPPNEFISEEDYEAWMTRGLPEIGDILLTTEAPLGEVAQLKDAKVALAQRLIALRGKKGVLWNSYLMYFWQSPVGQHRLRERESGTTVVGIKQSELKKIAVLLPPLETQKKIASILSAIDDKIELNNKINKNLEEQAQALFKSWFVDFEPFGGVMPEGWKIRKLGDEMQITGGATPSTKEPTYWDDGGLCWATPKDLSKLISPVLLDTDRHITKAGLEKISSGLLPKKTLLLSSRAPIGYLAITEIETAINQGFIAIKQNDSFSSYYMLLWCRQNMDLILGKANGSTFQEISKSSFRTLKFMVPSKAILLEFTTIIQLFYDKIAENTRENARLTALRDTLLPKLLRGEIDVSDVSLDPAEAQA